MEYLTGALLLLAFLVVVAAIVRGQSPIIMLLLLAIVWAALAGIGVNDIQAKVLQGGGVQYASAVIIIVFGAWFAQVLIQTGIAESVIRSAVELTGDRPVVTAMTITLVTALLFTSMYGVGAAIAIGVIALPIMMSQGIPARVAAPAFTMGIGAGCFVNIVLFGQFQTLFPGIKYEAPYLNVWIIGMVVYIAIAWLMIWINLRRLGVRHAASVDTAAPAPRKRTPYYTYLVPVFPVFMIMVFKWQIIPTFLSVHRARPRAHIETAQLSGVAQSLQQDLLRRFPGHRHDRRTLDNLRDDHRRRPDAPGCRCVEADLRSDPAAQRGADGGILRGAGRHLQHLPRSSGAWSAPGPRCSRSCSQTTRYPCPIFTRFGLRRQSCREALIPPTPGPSGQSAIPRYRTDSSSRLRCRSVV